MRRVSTAAPAGTIHANFRLRLELIPALMLSAIVGVVSFLVLAPSASAAKETIATIGGPISAAAGEFNQPRGIAVNQSGNGAPAGTFYVVDANNFRVQQFSPSGEFVRAWGWGVRTGEAEFEVCSTAVKCLKGIGGNEAGQLSNAQGIAVDQNTGNVFVANSGSRRISVYKPTGTFMGAFGWGAIDGGESLQFCTTGTGCGEPGPAAEASGDVGAGQFGSAIGGLATDAEGNLYVANRSSRRVDVFKPVLTGTSVTGVEWVRSFGWGAATGAPEFEVCSASPCKAPAGTGTGAGQFGANSPADVAVDSADNVYALDSGNKRVQKFDSTPAPIDKALGAAALTSTFGPGNLIAIAVEPDTDHVHVLGNRAGSANRVAIQELTSEGAAVETHATAATVNTAAGLAATRYSLGGTLYFSSNAEFQHRVFALNDTAPSIEPVTGISATEATFNGQVVSEEVESAYRFEYSSDNGVNWSNAPDPEGIVAAQPGSVAVSEAASGLRPKTEYRVRLAANRSPGTWTLRSPSVTFSTPGIAPEVEGARVTEVQSNSARLVGYLDPNNDATSYRFEYGTTTAYGNSIPVPEASAGGADGPVTVSQVLSGLAPGTTYHFRVVATNSFGSTVGSDRTFTTASTAFSPPPQRAFELVSPADTNGMEVADTNIATEPLASDDGEKLLFQTFGPLPGSIAGGAIGFYLSSRGAGGWSTDPISPPQNPDGLGATLVQGLEDELDRLVIFGPQSPQPAPGGGEGTSNLFQLTPATDVFKTISLGTAPDSPLGVNLEAVGSSANLDTVVFAYEGPALIEGVDTTDPVLYRWRENGSLDLVSRAPETNAQLSGPVRITSRRPADHAVSADGSKVFFLNQAAEAREIYVRIDGESTQHVSRSRRAVPDVPDHKVFRYASEDGAVAFFTSGQKLTEDSTAGPFSEMADLYRYEVETDELTDITVTGGEADNARVQGVLGGSADGSRLFFVATGELAPGAEAGEDNLYMWTDDGSAKGTIEFVAAGLDPQNFSFEPASSTNPAESPARVSPSGNHVVFTSRESLTGYPNAGHLEAYLYDVSTDELKCASCNPLGGPAVADVNATAAGELPDRGETLARDGSRLFFTTSEALVVEDENSVADVYEYEADADRVNLISSGTGQYPSSFQDASVDSQDVFFTTRNRLVGIDSDETIDVYNARVGGGFAGQNPPVPVPCQAGECRTPALPPPPQSPASATTQGPGNAVPKRAQKHKKKCKKGKKKRGKRCVGKRHGRR